MSRESKKPIEEMLEASAKARRAEFGADPKMPNPMRAHLHEEIARVARAAETQPRRGWLAIFWPQLSLVSAVAAVLVTMAIVWFGREKDSGRETQLAMRAPAPAESAKQPSDALRSLDQSAARDVTIAKSEANEEERNQPAVAAAPAQEFAAARSTAAKASQFAQATRGQAMRNFSPANQSNKVLENFQFEQNGKEIRLVDADGSTYNGTFERAEPAIATARSKKSKTAPAISSPNEQFFRASGFNNTLQKQVAFEGNYIPPQADEEKSTVGQLAKRRQMTARIVGRAMVPGEALIEVDAAPSSP